MSFLSWMQISRWELTREEQRGRIPSLDLLATLLLMQPRIWLAFWAALPAQNLMYVQVPQVVSNLTFSYSGRDFAPPVPVLWSIHSRGVGRETASEDRGREVVEYLSLLLICCYQFASLAHKGGCTFFDLPFLVDIPVEDLLVILCIPRQVQLQLHLGLTDPIILRQPGSVHIFFAGYLSLLLLHVHFLLAL